MEFEEVEEHHRAEVPELVIPNTGCIIQVLFQDEKCVVSEPDLVEIEREHFVRCFMEYDREL